MLPVDDPTDVLLLLGMFSSIYSLEVDTFYMEDSEDSMTKEVIVEALSELLVSPRLRVESLTLRNLESLPPAFWFEYLLRSPSKETLKRIDVHCDITDDIASLGGLLGDIGNGIITLSLDFSRCSDQSEFLLTSFLILMSKSTNKTEVLSWISRELSLTHCSVLRSVHVCILQEYLPSALNLLSSLPESTRAITLEFEVAGPMDTWPSRIAQTSNWEDAQRVWLDWRQLPLYHSFSEKLGFD